MKDADEMSLSELLDAADMTIYTAIETYCFDDGHLMDLINIAHDTEGGSVAHQAAIGKRITDLLGDSLREEVKGMDEPEQMLGNFAYDAIAKDRASN